MTLAHTSRYAYNRIKPKLGHNQKIVYDTIRSLGKASNEQIATALDWQIQSVTGRVRELFKYGVIGVEGLGKTRSGFSCKLWSVQDDNFVQQRLIENDN